MSSKGNAGELLATIKICKIIEKEPTIARSDIRDEQSNDDSLK
jgi:hypothetical protein